jgi:hypothetical protein
MFKLREIQEVLASPFSAEPLGRREMRTKYWLEKLKVSDLPEALDAAGVIILKWSLRK